MRETRPNQVRQSRAGGADPWGSERAGEAQTTPDSAAILGRPDWAD